MQDVFWCMTYTILDLAMAERCIAEDQRHIARQQQIVETLNDDPSLAAEAEWVLHEFAAARREHEKHRATVARQLGAGG